MICLGIHDGHNSGATLFQNGKLLGAINEERITRIKQQGGLPEKSIDILLKENNLKYKDTEIVCANKYHYSHRLFGKIAQSFPSYISIPNKAWMIYHHALNKSDIFKKINEKINQYLIEKKIKNKNVVLIDHHTAHAASAYYTSGFKKSLCITCDCAGDAYSTTTFIGDKEKLIFKEGDSTIGSLGQFYGEITELLGFNPYKHGGKITGLAAYGDPKKAYNDVKAMFLFNKKIKNVILKSYKNKIYKKLLNYKREDVSAAAQKILEEEMTEYIRKRVESTGIKRISLAGGTFANVKLNQKIKNLEGIKEIFIHPGMGDEGLGLGAGLYYLIKKMEIKPFKIKDIYLGPEYTNNEIKEELVKQNIQSFEYLEDIESQIAEKLTKGKVVARFNGRMEYGPRALGNRSILYQTTDPSVNDWLNKKLKRSEFMPFAPATMEEYTNKCYINTKGAEHAASFMTICFDCTNWMADTSPAVVHVDGTARPQLVNKKINASFYKILDEYRKITGIPSIINTSFNMHEEPIVCTPRDAIRSFKEGNIDYLAIGNYLIKN